MPLPLPIPLFAIVMMKPFMRWLDTLVSALMLLLGEKLLQLERNTKISVHLYVWLGLVIALLGWGLTYFIFSARDVTVVTSGSTLPLSTPVEPLPPRYLFFNDYYFFEEELDLEAASELILLPRKDTNLTKPSIKREFLERELFANDKAIIDNELKRLVR